jgi:hypothetical protein
VPEGDILSMAFAMLKAKNRFFHVLALKARTKVIINYIARPDRYITSSAGFR